MAAKAGLVILFNHRFERNIPQLENYYSSRFSHRRYIVPFAKSDVEGVVPVAENGWTFSGHIAQAAERCLGPVTHYAFVADDLILNPRLDETTLVERLGLDENTGYIKSLMPLDNVRYKWPWAARGTLSMLSTGFDHRSELPPAGEALEKFQRMGLVFLSPGPRNFGEALNLARWGSSRKSLYAFLVNLAVTGRRSPYPLLAGYSDFVVVPAGAMSAFAHYCGVFAAMNMFAEIAVPTALALACANVRTELAYNHHFIDSDPPRNPDSHMHGLELWEFRQNVEPFSKALDFSFSRLTEEFPEDRLYVHPIKLSKWK